MAKIGLSLGEKVQIADKSYRILNDAVDVYAVLGDLKYAAFEGPDNITEKVRQEDGTFREVPTGEIRGYSLGFKAGAQGGSSVFVTITDMSLTEIEALNLRLFDLVELEDVVIAYSALDSGDNYKVFASKVKKKVTHQPLKQKQEQHNENK
ncbi:TPA: conjugal transfer protein [Streptococcus suis]|nr:conjugal transfer protein [Streptococcus suis]HEM3699851.1 conjugal transfer protein [Streptococcus suis]HEM3714617.1 conjugal transfer protein [Streptococcus suis]